MAALVFFVKKKDRKLRLVQDYCALNTMTVKNKYPLPLILELIVKLHGAKYFTKLDVWWGFNNVQIKEADEWKAAFWTNRSLYEPLVMFFGLTNSPATFQTMMDDICDVVVVYLDDILIFMETLEEHRNITCRILELLEKHKLYLCSDKYEFEKTTIEYLRGIISHNSVAMDPIKIAGVTKWPTLMSKKEVQSFLGFTNFYQRFIRDFSEHTRLLFNLTQNDSGWHWGEAKHTAFARLKGSVISALVLISPNPTKPFHIEADSSNFATGAVVSLPLLLQLCTHKPGKSMSKPDALSHRSDYGTSADDNSNIVLLTPKLFAVRALEGLQLTGPEWDILRDIRQGTKQPKEEPVAQAAQELRKSSTCSL